MIYLDNAATTCPSKKALEFAEKYNYEKYFNPSALYLGGIEASKDISISKDKILNSLGVFSKDYEVIFTSCGSESDNMAVFCAKKRGVFVTDKGEHSAIYKSFCELKQRGLTTEFIDLNSDGSVKKEKLFEYVKNNEVAFVSIVHVNNETGAINDVNYIAKTLKQINKSLIFHVDGVQSYGKIPFILSKDIDLYSVSAHKINGLKGVGALIRKKTVALSPLIFGGGQENGLRSGTENVFGIKVFEYALTEHFDNIKQNFDYVLQMNKYVRDNLDQNIFHIISSENASPYVLSVSARNLKGEVIMHSLEEYGIIVGNGSACSSKNRFSRVIEACGYKKDILDGVIRISFSQDTIFNDVKFATDCLNLVARKLKGIMN